MGDELVVRPDYRTGVLVLVILAVVAVGVIGVILVGDAPEGFALIVGVPFAALIPLCIGALVRARITVTAHELVVQDLTSVKVRPRSHVAEVVRASITAPRGGAGESLFVLDAQRQLLVRVHGGLYGHEDLGRLVDALGVPCSGPDGPVSPKKFAEAYPGLLPWAERHPYRLAFGFAGLVCVVGLVVVLVAIAAAS